VIDAAKSASLADTKNIFPSYLPRRMALIDYVSPEEADGLAREVLEAYRDEHGDSALFNEALANNGQVLDARFEYGTRLMDAGEVDADIKEFVFLVVSETNECEYCVDDHRDALVQRFGSEERDLDAIATGEFDRFPERERAVVEFAEQVARDPKRVSDADLTALRSTGYDDKAVVELLAVAALAVSANTIVDALSIHPADRPSREN
jgi:uncharacterized peroxidase-related enzyme